MINVINIFRKERYFQFNHFRNIINVLGDHILYNQGYGSNLWENWQCYDKHTTLIS